MEFAFDIDELDNENNSLTRLECEALTELFEKPYKIMHSLDGTFFETKIGKIRKNKVSNYSYLSRKTPNPKTELRDEEQIARWVNGLPLEKLTQYALTLAHISYSGNPMNPKHYAHSANSKYNSNKAHVDIETEHMLIECTNPKRTTWLNDQIMNEKLDYFKHDDPNHARDWLIITSYKNWGKAIDKRIREDNYSVLVLNTCINRHTIKKQYYFDLKDIFTKLEQQTNQNLERIRQVNEMLDRFNIRNQKYNSKHRAQYTLIENNNSLYQKVNVKNQFSNNHCETTFSLNNKECLSG